MFGCLLWVTYFREHRGTAVRQRKYRDIEIPTHILAGRRADRLRKRRPKRVAHIWGPGHADARLEFKAGVIVVLDFHSEGCEHALRSQREFILREGAEESQGSGRWIEGRIDGARNSIGAVAKSCAPHQILPGTQDEMLLALAIDRITAL